MLEVFFSVRAGQKFRLDIASGTNTHSNNLIKYIKVWESWSV